MRAASKINIDYEQAASLEVVQHNLFSRQDPGAHKCSNLQRSASQLRHTCSLQRQNDPSGDGIIKAVEKVGNDDINAEGRASADATASRRAPPAFIGLLLALLVFSMLIDPSKPPLKFRASKPTQKTGCWAIIVGILVVCAVEG